ncbi:uncharacterized protein LOC115319455 [Ixodes scapularis]|uniref:uncharacterized protein LOC115319455 n=1 Tax=Ixodes scapularis TaxID=6945 RepID=UPI001C37F4DD|nr:uncharacterized protein LOC115319455 [Ixodes scapularis]
MEPLLAPPSTTERASKESFFEERVAPSHKPAEEDFLLGDISLETPRMCSSPVPVEDADTTYEPSRDESYLSDSAPSHPPHEEKKYIVFQSCLLQLFRQCITCHATCTLQTWTQGTMIKVKAVCPDKHTRTWLSQPLIKNKAACNVLLSTAIVATGSSPYKVLRLLELINIQAIAERTYFLYQTAIVQPAIERVWNREQKRLLEERRGKKVHLAGDGRFDSPGFSAKYMTYTFMEMDTNQVVYFVQVCLGEAPEVKTSNSMELYGCVKGIDFLKQQGITIEDLVTDRHVAIKGHMKTKEPEIHHYFDAWHIAKGVSKKMLAASKYAGCGALVQWAQPASNHVYWCAANSEGDGKLLVDMWKSINNHASDVHTGHRGIYNRCLHDPLIGEREWLSPGTPAYKRFAAITTQRLLLRDLEHVSPAGQTYNLESYHSTLTRFAPKSVAFKPGMMLARTRLAALHHNENSTRSQALTRDGRLKWKRRMQRAKKGIETVKKEKTKPTYAYVGALLHEVVACCNESSSFKEALEKTRQEEVLPMASLYPRLPKEQLVAQRMSRFSRGAPGHS